MQLMNTEIRHCTMPASGIMTSLLRFAELRLCCMVIHFSLEHAFEIHANAKSCWTPGVSVG